MVPDIFYASRRASSRTSNVIAAADSIRPPILMDEGPTANAVGSDFDVVLGIVRGVAGASVAHFEINDICVAAVDEMVRDTPGWKARAHTRRHCDFAAVCDERGPAFQNEDELILLRMAMLERRFTARGKTCQVHAEVFEREAIAEWTFVAARHAGEKRLGIVRPLGAGRHVCGKDSEGMRNVVHAYHR